MARSEDQSRGASDECVPVRIELSDAEVVRLAEILDRQFSPARALRKALLRLADPNRRPPRLRWKDSAPRVDVSSSGASSRFPLLD